MVSLNKRRTTILCVTLGIAVALGAVVVPAALAHSSDSNKADDSVPAAGTIKVHNPGQAGSNANDPHVGCSFFIEGFGMTASSGTITFFGWPPTGSKTVVTASGAAETWSGATSTTGHGGFDFDVGAFSLPSGHYKVQVTDGDHVKTKVFWVDCSVTPPGSTPGTNETTNGTTPGGVTPPGGHAEVPFFPSVGSLLLGVAGASGSVLFATRRLR
jgi:hypothetical protein